ncbi:regulatory protein, gntR family [Desulfonispora thiosulfatigenes DSM 11270]|uniref:Regulatory protein, gntR family n=1 Tax=Desulfonispora thiosulfatigenes DSM 11270 TaxID=656914 RepID=A0A1W1V427_DESTI|nr:TrkA C-terminal domain-containing protein [Desulfonispora thiosulfatigenes]SMB88157.1 regulatory protein, gntR family [Desulfonispora thiosulfatigenes DSM 11270]
MGNYKDINEIPRYEQIAVDLATKVAHRDYPEGTKLYGRSTLAGQYNVSPETIRRAVALLQTMNIVEVVTGKGIIVKNHHAALQYIESFKQRRALAEAQEEFSKLLKERREIDIAIEQQIKKIMNFSSRLVNILPKVEEVVIPEDSLLVGKSLVEVDFRSKTDATVLSIERNGAENFSPDINMLLLEGDVLVYIGPENSKKKVEKFVNA